MPHSFDICLTCPMAMFSKLPYFANESKCAHPFELIHIDIWGPYRVLSQGKCRYFLTIVDDCSRATWRYLLQYKSQALATLQSFYNYVLNHFKSSIQIIRSDNALEFDCTPCTTFFHSKGIVHQTSCVDRPQQNGRVERKHRHLLEIARALRFQAALPLHFWGDAMLAIAYIINRLPTPILQHQTPYKILLGTKPDCTHLRVFGCLAFASNLVRTSNKFQPRGVPCVLLGYSHNQKGYRFLNMLTKQVCTSRDVQFYEHIFSFHKSSLTQYLQPIPAPIFGTTY